MKFLIILFTFILSGCGYSSINSTMIGQVKKVGQQTPLVCPDFIFADISLGIMRNGVGSMSSEDVYVYVSDLASQKTLKEASESGELVNIIYDIKRVTFCIPDHIVKKVEIIK